MGLFVVGATGVNTGVGHRGGIDIANVAGVVDGGSRGCSKLVDPMMHVAVRFLERSLTSAVDGLSWGFYGHVDCC